MNNDDKPLTRFEREVLPSLVACACAIAQKYFPCRDDAATTLQAVEYVVTGKYNEWDRFTTLSEPEQERLARLLGHRPNPLAHDLAFRQHALEQLHQVTVPGFRLTADGNGVTAHHGRDPLACADRLLDELDKRRKSQARPAAIAGPGAHTHLLRIPMAGQQRPPVLAHYTFSDEDIPQRQPPLRLRTAPSVSEAVVKIDDFIDLNAELDTATGKTYRAETLTPYFANMQTTGGHPVGKALRLTAGPLLVVSAPTGSGKSVQLRSQASWAVREGHTIALVVDTNANALKLAYGIEEDLRALGLLTQLGRDAQDVVVPLMSPNSLARELDRAIRGSDDPDYVQWVFSRIGYSCQLPSYASTEDAVDTWAEGNEPCTVLTPDRPDRLDEPYRNMPGAKVCPFKAKCLKFRLARQATTARVIITTHGNLHEGRMHIPLELDDDAVDEKVTVEEFLLRHCQIIVIDEIDAFQSSAMDHSGRGLTLVWGDRRHDRPLLDVDAQLMDAFGRTPAALEERTRSHVSECRRLAETYAMHLSRGDLQPSDQLPEHQGRSRQRSKAARRWVIPDRWDSWLVKHLTDFFTSSTATQTSGDDSKTANHVLLEAICDVRVASHLLPEHVREFAQSLRSVTTSAGVAGALEVARGALHETLAGSIKAPKTRAAVIDRLVRRMFLVPLRAMLHGFVNDAPQLKLAGVHAAEDIARALGTYDLWRAVPHGPLGRLLFAFTEDHNPEYIQDTKLSTAAFGGDPHRYTTTLGGITALAHAGHRRIVMGLSATAYLPGAHRHHVHTKPAFIVPDDGSTVEIDARPIPGMDEELIRISGLSGKKRREATRLLGEKLWRELSVELDALASAGAPGVQDAILLATTSYQSCRDLAEGMRRAGAPPGLIAVAVRPDEVPELDDEGDDLAWVEIPGDRLEDFGRRTDLRILIAPLKRAERSLNILVPGERRSRIGSIWLAVRPMSIVDEPDELLAHISAFALDDARSVAEPWLELARAKRLSGDYVDDILDSDRYFSALPARAKKAIAAELIASAIQLVGRARRGGTPGRLRLVDFAFLDTAGRSDLPRLIRELRADWERNNELDTVLRTNGNAIQAFFTFADHHVPTRAHQDTTC